MKKYLSQDAQLKEIVIDDCYLWKPDSFDSLKPFREHQNQLRSLLKSLEEKLADTERTLGSHGFNESSNFFKKLSGFRGGKTSLYSNPCFQDIKSLPIELSSYSSRIKSYCSQNSLSVPSEIGGFDRDVDSLFLLQEKTTELATKCFISDLPYYLNATKRKSTMTDIYIGHAKHDMSRIVIGKFDIDSRTYIEHFMIES